jgi:protein associated with RNAse G/E
MEAVIVRKLNLQCQETWRYEGQIIRHAPGGVILEAYFNRDDLPFNGTTFKRNDKFIEGYYMDRWYNIYEIYDRDTQALKCWYCNVSYPAEIVAGQISYVDLALDLLVFPDGRQLVLDEDEFATLQLSDADRIQARRALEELQMLFKANGGFRLMQ